MQRLGGDAKITCIDDHFAINQHERAPGPLGDFHVVRHQDHRQMRFAVELAEQLHDLATRARVQIPGRLIAEENRRPIDQGAGDGHALLLPTGKLIGFVIQAVGQAHLFEQLRGSTRSIAPAPTSPRMTASASLAIRRLSSADAGFDAAFEALLGAPPEADPAVDAAAASILADVQARGDAALLDTTRKFDAWSPASAADLEIPKAEWLRALETLPAARRTALERAAANPPRDAYSND